MELNLEADVAQLTATLIDMESVSGNERALADAIHRALEACPHLELHRYGDAIVARTNLGRERRVVLAGHLDTVRCPPTRWPAAACPRAKSMGCSTGAAPPT